MEVDGPRLISNRTRVEKLTVSFHVLLLLLLLLLLLFSVLAKWWTTCVGGSAI